MRGLLLLLAGVLLLSAVDARGFYGYCFVGDGKIVPNGSTWTASRCRQGKCIDGSVTYVGCFTKPPEDPSCYSDQDLSQPYPHCCPLIFCR